MRSKILTILFLFGLIICPALMSAQNVSLSYNKAPLKSVIKDIERQSDYTFVYSSALSNINDLVTINVKNKSLESVLSELFNPRGIVFKIVDKQIVLSPQSIVPTSSASKQATQTKTYTIKGAIYDVTNNEAIPFASVVVKGTKIGTSADVNGLYQLIEVPYDAVIEVSSVGYASQNLRYKGQLTADFSLSPDTEFLEETVVVAYGTAKKESITGAVAQIKTKDIENRAISSPTAALEGKMAGVQMNNTNGAPGSEPAIRIRGLGSVNGTNSPLYIIDGVPFGGSLSDLNHRDIESISVLKDASSAALYGNRASNGVIIITTKRGTSEKLNIRADVTAGVYQRGIQMYDMVDAYDFTEVMWQGYKNYLVNSATHYDEAKAVEYASSHLFSDILGTGYNIFNKSAEALFDAKGKLVSGTQMLQGYNDLDWLKEMERIGPRQEYNISIDGASDKVNYFFSAGYLDEKGYIVHSDFSRLSGRAKVNVTPNKWLKMGFNLSGTSQVRNNIDADGETTTANPFHYAKAIAPIYPIYLHDSQTGEYLLDDNGQRQYDDGTLYSRPQMLGRNWLWEKNLNEDQTYKTTLSSQAYLELKFLKDFTFAVKGDFSLRNSENHTYYTSIIGDAKGEGAAYRTFYRYINYTFQQQLTWAKEFGNHSIDILAAHENYSYNYKYHYLKKMGETFVGEKEFANFTDLSTMSGYQNNYKTESYLSRARYNYKGLYYLEASFRRDGSSRFAPGNRWGNFWSLGASWTMSKEQFMKNVNWINSMKLRASYGESGNDQSVGYYDYMALYTMSFNAGQSALYKSQNDANDISWEKAASFSAALDGRLFNRMNVTLEYFDKRTHDLLFNVSLPLSAGATSTSAVATITKNLGAVSNKGIEFSTDIDIIQGQDFNWNFGMNATFMKNRILTLPEENREDGIISGRYKFLEGRSMYDFYLYQFAGVDQMTGSSLYLPDEEVYYCGVNNGEADTRTALPEEYLVKINDKYYTTRTTYAKKDFCGSAIPTVYGSLSTAVEYKNFSLSVLCTYALGGKTFDYSYGTIMDCTSSPAGMSRDILNAWNGVPEGMTETSANRIAPNGVPIVDYFNSTYNNAESSRFLTSGNYFVIKNISLGYKLSKRAVNKLDIGGLSFNLSVENLASFTARKGMNPQQNYSGTSTNTYTTARVFSLGVSLAL